MATKKKPVAKEKPAAIHTGKWISEGKAINEGVTPKPEPVEIQRQEGSDCKRSDCRHPSKMHYGSKDLWCNTSGCTCQAYVA